MIKLVGFLDISAVVGRLIYKEESSLLDPELIYRLVSAIVAFTSECTGERDFHTTQLENIRILVLPINTNQEKDPLRYVVCADLFDNVEYIKTKVMEVNKLLTPYLDPFKFNPPQEKLETAREIITFTQKFPSILVEEDQTFIQQKLKSMKDVQVLDLFLGDIDEGIVQDFVPYEEILPKTPSKLFYDLLVSVSFEEDLWLDTLATPQILKKLQKPHLHGTHYEGWNILRIGRKTDFFLVSYFIFDMASKDLIRKTLREIAQFIAQKIEEAALPARPF
ncbi:MAG: hypothetical protein ACFFDT_01840 [Candidatus Hodarchaeota archaeon]